MGFPTSEVGYTAAMHRRKDHKVHKDMWGHWTKNLKGLFPQTVKRRIHTGDVGYQQKRDWL